MQHHESSFDHLLLDLGHGGDGFGESGWTWSQPHPIAELAPVGDLGEIETPHRYGILDVVHRPLEATVRFESGDRRPGHPFTHVVALVVPDQHAAEAGLTGRVFIPFGALEFVAELRAGGRIDDDGPDGFGVGIDDERGGGFGAIGKLHAPDRSERDRIADPVTDDHDRAMAGHVHLEITGGVATITNDNPEKHNAFDDDMDAQLFDALGELKERRDVRAIVWRGVGKSWSSGRDVASIGTNVTELTHHELMTRGHKGIQQIWDIEAPIIVAIQGWALGGSFQRALMCDIRIAAEGAKFMLPEVGHGVIPDTGGMGVLYEMCGHGVVSDLVLTGRRMEAEEALGHGIISRIVPPDQLDDTAHQMAEKIAASPTIAVKLARKVIGHLSRPQIRSSMDDEMIYQTFLNKSEDYAEFRAARAEDREPNYRGT